MQTFIPSLGFPESQTFGFARGATLVKGSMFFLPLIADLGLERNPNVERGLLVWAAIVVFFVLVTLWLAIRRDGILSVRRTVHQRTLTTAETSGKEDLERGWPFMKKSLWGVGQVIIGILVVYALAQVIAPRLVRPKGWHLVSPPHEVTVLTKQGNIIWAGGKEGLFAIHRESLVSLEIPVLKARDLRGVRALLAEGNSLWIGCQAGLFLYHSNRLEQVIHPENQDLGPVNALCRARDGTIWIGTQMGAWRMSGRYGRDFFVSEKTIRFTEMSGHWQRFGPSEGLLLSTVDVIYQDRVDNIWFGSNEPEALGLFRFDGRQFSNLSAGLTSRAVNDLMEDHTGTFWVATGFSMRGGAARFLNNEWKTLSDIPDLSTQKIRSLFEDSRHRLWFCSEYNGVAIWNGAAWKRVILKEGLPGAEVKDMLEDEDGTLWLATERGLGCLRSAP